MAVTPPPPSAPSHAPAQARGLSPILAATLLAIGGLLLTATVVWLARAPNSLADRPDPRLLPNADRDPVVLAHQLRSRDSFYRRHLCRTLATLTSYPAARWPRLFDPHFSATDRLRLEAHSALLGLGPQAAPAFPLLADALADSSPTVQTYALVVLAHLQANETQTIERLRPQPRRLQRALTSLAGVLGDEDERVREFAWRAFAVAGPDSLSPFLPTLQTITQDPTFVALPYVQETLRKLPQTEPAHP